jgi:hypothetical protein
MSPALLTLLNCRCVALLYIGSLFSFFLTHPMPRLRRERAELYKPKYPGE